MTLHDASEALASAHRGHVDPFPGLEHVDLELVTDREAVDVVDAQLDQVGAGLHARLLEVAGLGLGELARVLVAVRDLKGGVPVALTRLDLHDACRGDFEHGDGDDAVVIAPHLGHAHFFADDGFRRHGRSFGFSRGRSARLLPAERWIGLPCGPLCPKDRAARAHTDIG